MEKFEYERLLQDKAFQKELDRILLYEGNGKVSKHYGGPSRRQTLFLLFIFTVLIIPAIIYYSITSENSTIPQVKPSTTKRTGSTSSSRKAYKSIGAKFECPLESLEPSRTIPADVDHVRPADIKVIAALGDSYTTGVRSHNFEGESSYQNPGNSYITGGDESMETLSTLANILKHLNPSLIGYSTGNKENGTRGFNVAVPGKTCRDLPRQAAELVMLMKQNEKVNIAEDWKFISIFIGTNDLNSLGCRHMNEDPISGEEYKRKLEETIAILAESLPRSIISIISMVQSQFLIEAKSIVNSGERLACNTSDVVKKRTNLIKEYRAAVYSIQNEKKFHSSNFTVVVQGFMDEINEPYRNASGQYDKGFYAVDEFHMSKFGNAIVGKFLWNSLLEPVGKKNTKANFADEDSALLCPNEKSPFIQTVGNSILKDDVRQ